MLQLALPTFEYKLKKNNRHIQIWDNFRQKFVALTPEEWVRQNLLTHLTNNLGYPKQLLSVEHTIELNTMKRRCDAVIFDKTLQPHVLLECKAPFVEIDADTYQQIWRYNLVFNAPHLILSNGIQHYYIHNSIAGIIIENEIPYYEIIDTTNSTIVNEP